MITVSLLYSVNITWLVNSNNCTIDTLFPFIPHISDTCFTSTFWIKRSKRSNNAERHSTIIPLAAQIPESVLTAKSDCIYLTEEITILFNKDFNFPLKLYSVLIRLVYITNMAVEMKKLSVWNTIQETVA